KSPHPAKKGTVKIPANTVLILLCQFVGNLLNNAAFNALFMGIMKLINNLVILVCLFKILLVTVRRNLT
ncbi:MAG: hypothetical protein VX061_15075, partial [Pseudomonadota bacterium]|nr:hypothetical protein [Pseudomonadota bacterium]